MTFTTAWRLSILVQLKHTNVNDFRLEKTMQVTIVHVHVKPEHIDDFIEASRINHEASIKEPGNRRFDVLQLSSDPTHFVLYEAYANPADAAAHKQTAHYLNWRETVADWMAEPRQGIGYYGLFPAE
jgi:autoinducer 2-degrading protein